MRAFGYVQHGPFIVTFGGFRNQDSSDDIFILDLRSDNGWIQSSLKCPHKSTYHAVLDNKQYVHLHTTAWGQPAKHYRVKWSDIITKFVIK